MLCDMKRNIRFLVSYKSFKDRTLLYNSCYTHMHITIMLMRCFSKTVQCNTEGVTSVDGAGAGAAKPQIQARPPYVQKGFGSSGGLAEAAPPVNTFGAAPPSELLQSRSLAKHGLSLLCK